MRWDYSSCIATLKINENRIFCEFSGQVVLALGSKYQYRSWLHYECLVCTDTNIRCGRYLMKLCDQSSRLLRKKCKGHKLQLFPQTILFFFVLGFCFFPAAIHYHIQTKHLRRKNSTLANNTRLFLQHGYVAHGVQDFLLLLLHSSQHMAAHVDWTQYFLKETVYWNSKHWPTHTAAVLDG